MSLQALPRRRVASPLPIPSPLPTPAAKISRFPVAPPHLWLDLSRETQTQIARTLAELVRRMLPAARPGKEVARVDRRERR
jgi:hypothetical protein